MNERKVLWKYEFTEGVGNKSARCPFCNASYDWYEAINWFNYCPHCGEQLIQNPTTAKNRAITEKQQRLINKIEDTLNVKFEGRDIKDAYLFIAKHFGKFREANALNHVDRWQADNGNF